MKSLIFLVFICTSAFGQNGDAKLLDQMIYHFQDTIRLGEIAQERAQGLEIKRMARKVIREEKGWLKQLNRWRQEYYEEVEEEIILPKDFKVLKTVNNRSFDELLLRTMIDHQTKALEIVRNANAKATRRFIHEFARDADKDLTDEVGLLHELQNAYHEDRLTP